MEKEISSGVMLGIVLIALAAIIGLGFGIFSIAKGTANSGVVDVQDNLGQVSESGFDDFNQKIITGTQVKSAYSTYQGKPYAVLILTEAVNGDASNSTLYDRIKIAMSDGATYINYNAVLATGTITFSNGTYEIGQGFSIDSTTNRIQYYSVTDNLSKSGMLEYIPANARFEANLIKDKSGTIMGMAFRQVAAS